MAAEPTPELLTIEEAARWLRIGRSKAYALVKAGELPSVAIGQRQRRVPALALRAWVQHHTSAGSVEAPVGEVERPPQAG